MNDRPFDQMGGDITLDKIYGDVQNISRLFSLFIALTVVGIVAGIFIVLTTNNMTAALLLGLGLFPALLSWRLMRAKRFEAAAGSLAVFFILLNTLLSTMGLGIHSINNIAFPVVLIIGSLVVNRRVMFLLTTLTVLCLGWLVFGELNGWYTVGVLERSVPGDFLSASLIVIVTAIMAYRLTDSLFKGFHRLNAEIEERNKLEESLRQQEAVLKAVSYFGEEFLKSPDWRSHIDDVLEHLGKALNVTHAYIFEDHLSPQGEPVTSMRFEWTKEGFPSDLDLPVYQNSPIHQEGFEEQVKLLSRGEIRVGTLSTFNPIEKAIFAEQGVKAILEVPVFVSAREWGAIGFDDFEKERQWRTPEMDALKIAAGILGAAIQREKSDSAVQVSERNYRQAIEAAGAIPYYRDYIERRYTFMGEGIASMTGYSAAEITPQIWDRLFLEGFPRGSMAHLTYAETDRLTEEGRLHHWECDYRILDRHGRERWVADSCIQIVDNKGARIGVVGILQDITERKTIEVNLRKRESMLEAVTFSAEQFLASADWRERINVVLERLGTEFNASHAYLFERHPGSEGKLLNSMKYEWTAPGRVSDLDSAEFQNMPPRATGFDRLYDILDSGEPLVGSASFFTEEEKEYLRSITVKALLEIRVIVNGRHWGTLGFDDADHEREWEPMEVDVIKVAAGVLGAAIERQVKDDMLKAELGERIQIEADLSRRAEEMALLYRLGTALAGGENLYQALRAFLSELKQIMTVDAFHIGLYDEETDILSYSLFLNLGADFQPPPRSLRESPGLTWEVISNRKTLYLTDVADPQTRREHHIVWIVSAPIRSYLGIPLMLPERVIGVMSVQSLEPAAYSPDQIRLLETIAAQVVITIEKSSLLERLKNELGERRKAEEDRENLIEELSERNTELERFTYTVSHDLKSPLVTIAGFLRYMEQDVVSGNMERFRTDMNRVQAAVEKMQRLLMELLELSRVGRIANPPVTIPFDDLVHEAMEAVHGRLESSRAKIVVQPDLPDVYGDHPRLVEVLQNLIDNAAKYLGSQPDPAIEIGQRGLEGGRPVYFVKDNGIGIAPEHHNRIFELFNKLDASSEGTGVGLALVKRIIEFHGGRIWVESEPGKGSAFYFTLPGKPDAG
ncbi:MAG: GAF domain-containing protein [Chloroflexi bacterium]|nr:GAF domain-containing protein [Chloroflexota bacterium]